MRNIYPVESATFVLLLGLCHFGIAPSNSALFPSALFGGELWRWFTYAWAHISLYHLVLDGAAFLGLYHSLRCNFAGRFFHLSSSIFMGGLVPILLEPRLDMLGLRGLSGVAHGLMVVTAFESLLHGGKGERGLGALLLGGVVVKVSLEQMTGEMLFANYHLGDIGFPVVSCHLGGALGGAVSYWVSELWMRASQARPRGAGLAPDRKALYR